MNSLFLQTGITLQLNLRLKYLIKRLTFWIQPFTKARDFTTKEFLTSTHILKGRDHGYAHARRLSLQNKFVGSTLNSKSPLLVQSLKILRFIPTSVA